jgi:predicted phosphodiesterase
MSEITISSGYRFETIFRKSDGTTEISNRVNYNRALKEYYDATAPEDAVALYIGGRCNTGIEFGSWVEDLGDSSNSTSILSLNPESEWKPKMQAARKQYYSSTYKNIPNSVVLAHISDIHGNWANVSRFLEFCNYYSDYIDEKIQTGDLVRQYYTNSISGYTTIEGAENIIGVIGNHDTYHSGGTWAQHAGLDAYNKFIAPFISNWNVVQPANAAVDGKCYFYKDYTTQSLRLIFTDGMGWNADQNTWLADTLEDARTNEYDVMIVTHFAGNNPVATKDDPAFDIPTANWQTTYTIGTSASQIYGYNANLYQMMDRVDEFITAGGVFVGYLQGHYHKDFVAKVHRYPNQMIYSIGGSLMEPVGDYDHETGTKMQDEFEIVGIDTYSKVIKLFKVGANIDRFGTVKNSIAVKYDTATILRES